MIRAYTISELLSTDYIPKLVRYIPCSLDKHVKSKHVRSYKNDVFVKLLICSGNVTALF